MKYSEWDDSNNTLCCCEYYNIEEERSHILGCCCNCVALDESCESLIRGERISQQHKTQVMATIQDRVRIPWRGGAKQISASVDTLVPVILVPALVFIAAYDLILTIVIFILTPIFLNHTHHWLQANHPRSKFFFIWTIMSALTVSLIFEVKVISLLEILPEENLALFVLFCLTIIFISRIKLTANQWQQSQSSSLLALPPQDLENNCENFCTNCKRRQQQRMHHCTICQNCIAEQDFHFVWFDCCIGSTNKGSFLLSLIFAMATLLYGSNLTLTTVCHPFTLFGTFMLPDDCSDVYELYDMSLCFTTAIYSLLMALYLFYIYIRYTLLISIGVTGQEWLQMPYSTRLRCGLYSTRPYDQGIIKNWFNTFVDYLRANTHDRNYKSSTYFET